MVGDYNWEENNIVRRKIAMVGKYKIWFTAQLLCNKGGAKTKPTVICESG